MAIKTDVRTQCVLLGLPAPEPEWGFLDDRQFRWDWAWPEHRVALEQQGGTWTQGRHTRGKGYENDAEKLNEGQLAGWLVLWSTTRQVETGAALAWVRRALEQRGWRG